MVHKIGGAHIAVWDRSEAHAGAIFDDGMASAVQVYVDVLALVDPHLPRGHNENAVGDARYVRRPGDVASDDEALVDILEGETREGGAGSTGRGRHVDNAPLDVS